ncbi:MAG: hypothetical protein FD163_299 [Hyphomonadaceae bacterium]|nr:MAG: hypothetical protein FD163_299 [Hyphomonadaceae bacterium]
MLLNCPACSAKYQIAKTAIPEAGRNVRCAACGHFWYQLPFDDENELELNQSTAVRDIGSQDSTNNKGFGAQKSNSNAPHEKIRKAAIDKKIFLQVAAIAIGWVLAIAVVGGGLFAAISNRNSIVAKWPKSASAFAFIGVPANIYGIEITQVKVRSGIDAQGPRLVVSGVIKSISNTDKLVPYLRVVLVDASGVQKAKWLADPGVTVLKAHGKKEFETIWRNPPAGQLVAIVTFSQPPTDVARPSSAKVVHSAPHAEPQIESHGEAADKLAGANETTHAPAPTAGR